MIFKVILEDRGGLVFLCPKSIENPLHWILSSGYSSLEKKVLTDSSTDSMIILKHFGLKSYQGVGVEKLYGDSVVMRLYGCASVPVTVCVSFLSGGSGEHENSCVSFLPSRSARK